MKLIALVLTLALAVPAFCAGGKLTQEERIQIIRGMMSEYSIVKVLLPRAKKALSIQAGAAHDKQEFAKALQENGPAGRVGDLIQVTKVELDDEKITLQLNGGFKGGRKWYENVQVGGGVGMNTRTVPIGGGGVAQAGTTVALVFPKDYEALTVAGIKTWLKPVLDFDRQRSATENPIEQLPPEIQQAVKEKRATEGMDRDTVILAMGKPRTKTRETNKDGLEVEDWIYGQAPGKITFVTFDGNKVIKVKETYAGLGGENVKPLSTQN